VTKSTEVSGEARKIIQWVQFYQVNGVIIKLLGSTEPNKYMLAPPLIEVIEVDKGVGMTRAGNGRGSKEGRSKKDLVEKDGESTDKMVLLADDKDGEEGGGGVRMECIRKSRW
jgi:hypothetical protein